VNHRIRAAGLALLVPAVLLPPAGLAGVLASANDAHLAAVTAGVWWLKGMLALAGLLLAALSWKPLPRRDGEPLLVLDREGPTRTGALEGAAVGAVLGLALALRLYRLGDGIWYDEIETLIGHVRLPLGDVVTTYTDKNQHLLYSALARLSIELTGESTAALRLPAALFGVASLWALWRFALRITRRREALVATALCALTYQHLWFSQNARGYTGLMFFTLVGSSLLLDLLAARAGPLLGKSIGYGLCMALAIYVHLSGLFAVVGHGLVWSVLALRARRRKRVLWWSPAPAFVFTALFTMTCYALVLPQFVGTVGEPVMAGHASVWDRPMWLVTETLGGLARGLPGGWITLGLGLVVVALGLISYTRQSVGIPAVFLAGAGVTVAAVLAAGGHLWPRFFFFAFGFLVLIVVRGAFALPQGLAGGPLERHRPRLEAALGVVMCAGAAAGMVRAYGPKQDFQGALAFVERARVAGDAVVTVEMTRMPYQRFWTTDWTPVHGLAELVEIERRHPRTWLVYTVPILIASRHPDIWSRIQRDYRVIRSFAGTLAGGAIVVTRRSAAAAAPGP
jgi:hypothetical protein